MTPRIGASRPLALFALGLLTFALPLAVAAHAELVSSSPAAGETVVGNPPSITAQYSETLDPDGSSLILVDPNGNDLARGGVVAAAGKPKEMSIQQLPQLAPGVYTVKSTTKSAEDGDVDRTTWQFRVAAPSPSPTAEPTPVCTDECAGQPSGGATQSPTPSPRPAPTPTASPAPGSTTGSGGDVILPIIVALAIVAIGGSLLIARGRRPGGAP